MRPRISNTEGQRGSALVEFLFSMVILVPLLIGTIAIGTEMIREIDVTQVCRQAAHMHAYGVDFTIPANKSLILQSASPLNITATGGYGAIILSTIEMVSEADCEAAGLTADSAHCPNLYHAVFTKRILIGNSSFASGLDTNGPPVTDASGSVSQNRILQSVADRVDNFSPPFDPSGTGNSNAVLLLKPGEIAYVGEVFLKNDDLTWAGFGATPISSRAIF
jgi:hypothetical protein